MLGRWCEVNKAASLCVWRLLTKAELKQWTIIGWCVGVSSRALSYTFHAPEMDMSYSWDIYPLVNVYKRLWNITIFNGKIHYNWPFSIAIWQIYQRADIFSELDGPFCRVCRFNPPKMGLYKKTMDSAIVLFINQSIDTVPQDRQDHHQISRDVPFSLFWDLPNYRIYNIYI